MEVQVSNDEEHIEPTVVPSRKRKQPSDSQPSSISVPSPARESTPVHSPSPKNIYTDPIPSPSREESVPPIFLGPLLTSFRTMRWGLQLYDPNSMPIFPSIFSIRLSETPMSIGSAIVPSWI